MQECRTAPAGLKKPMAQSGGQEATPFWKSRTSRRRDCFPVGTPERGCKQFSIVLQSCNQWEDRLLKHLTNTQPFARHSAFVVWAVRGLRCGIWGAGCAAGTGSAGCTALHPRLFEGDRYAVAWLPYAGCAAGSGSRRGGPPRENAAPSVDVPWPLLPPAPWNFKRRHGTGEASATQALGELGRELRWGIGGPWVALRFTHGYSNVTATRSHGYGRALAKPVAPNAALAKPVAPNAALAKPVAPNAALAKPVPRRRKAAHEKAPVVRGVRVLERYPQNWGVEAAGIEPASRDISAKASTCVADSFTLSPLGPPVDRVPQRLARHKV